MILLFQKNHITLRLVWNKSLKSKKKKRLNRHVEDLSDYWKKDTNRQ